MRHWLDRCTRTHGADYDGPDTEQSGTSDIPGLMLIDVQNQCLVNAPERCRYMALSYVWGKHKFIHTTKENLDLLRTAGSLADPSRDIPTTIVDAMDLVSLISEQYLWVDSLCTVQNDSSQKDEMVSSMDLVYRGALATIIAATSDWSVS
jgi:hypothetical protein